MDWKAAEKHRLANSVVRTTMIDLDSHNIEKCNCCQLPVPHKHHYFSCFDDEMDFGQMGAPGFPLFFELNKQIGLLFFLLLLAYFVPMMIMWTVAYQPM